MNIALDFFTILVLGMGVSGPALATVISQGISAALCLIYMIRHYPILHMKQGEWQPDGRMLRALCGMGIPMGLQYSITAIGSVVLQTAVNSLGSMAVAAVSTGSKVSMFFCCPFDALGGTMATYAGQNVGAKKLDRVKEGLKAASLIGIIYSLIAFVVLLFGGRYIALLFMDADQTEIIGRVATFLIGNSMFYIPLTFVNVVRFTIQGMGFSTFAILAGVCEMAARSLVGFMNFLMWFGYTTILLLAGMLGIDTSLSEAAEVDGATSTQVFFKITLPLLRPILVYVMVTSLIGGLQMYDVPQILTHGQGNPARTTMTLIMYLNKHLYSKNYGLGGALSVILFIVTGILSVIVFRMNQASEK